MTVRFSALGLLWIGLAALPTAYADTITLRADNWCPYNCEPNSDQPGYMVEIAKEVFAKAGHQIDYQLLNWARALEEVRAGKFNGVVGCSKGDAGDFIFTENELGLSLNGFAVRVADSWDYQGLDSLGKRKLGVVRDYSYGDAINAYLEKHKSDPNIETASGDNALEINLRKLSKGRIDTIVDGKAVLGYNIKRLSLDKELKLTPSSEEGDPVYIAFGPNQPNSAAYSKLLNDGIAEMRKSGRLAEILARYGLTDWKGNGGH